MAEELTTLTVKDFIREMLKINIDYVMFLTNSGPRVLNFNYNEELNRIQLLSEDNHNFLLDKNKINTRKVISRLLDFNLNAEVYYNDKPVVAVYENTSIRRIYIALRVVNEDEDKGENLTAEVLDYLKLFSDQNYYNSYIKELLKTNLIKPPSEISIIFEHKSNNWDDLLDV